MLVHLGSIQVIIIFYQILFHPSRLSAVEEDSGDINGDDNIFEADDYYNYNEFLSYFF